MKENEVEKWDFVILQNCSHRSKICIKPTLSYFWEYFFLHIDVKTGDFTGVVLKIKLKKNGN